MGVASMHVVVKVKKAKLAETESFVINISG